MRNVRSTIMRLYYFCSRYVLLLFLLVTLPCSSQIWWKSGLPETSFAVYGGNAGIHLHASQDRYAMNSSRIPYLTRNGLSDVALTSSKQVCAVRCDSLQSDTLEIWFAEGEDYWSRDEAKNSPTARQGFAIAAFDKTTDGGRILLFGGQDDRFRYGETWIYNENTKSWNRSITQRYPPARTRHQLCGIAGTDSVLLFGGVGASGIPMNDVWIYDYSARTWTEIRGTSAPKTLGLPVGVQQLGASDSIVISDGGSVRLFEMKNNAWSVLADTMPFDTVGEETFMAKGQYNDTTISFYQRNRITGTTTNWNFNIRNVRWAEQYRQPPAKGSRALLSFGDISSIMLFVNPGDSGKIQPWFYDVSSFSFYRPSEYWSPDLVDKNAPKLYPFTASTISNGSQSLLGGLILGQDTTGEWQTWQYGLINDTYFSWKRFPTVTTPKGDTSLMVFAGGQGKNVLVTRDSTWMFDWAAKEWHRGVTSPPFYTKFGMTAVSLGQGRPGMIAVASDTGTTDRCATWIFDCTDKTWRKIPTTGAPSKRTGCAITSIDTKLMLLYGGNDETGKPLFDTWLFDFTDSSWVNIIPATNAKLRLENPMIVSSYSPSPTILAGFAIGTTEWQTWKFILKTARWNEYWGGSSAMLFESPENDGSIARSFYRISMRGLTYTNFPFVSFSGIKGEDFIQTGKAEILDSLPKGLYPMLLKEGENSLELRLTGKAIEHSYHAHSFTLALHDAAITTGYIKGVENLNKISFFIVFSPNISIETLPPVGIASDRAVLSGFLPKPKDGILKQGFVYGTSSRPKLDSGQVVTLPSEQYGEYSASVTGLRPLTRYYVRAYCVAQGGFNNYGNEISFITAPVSVPETPDNLVDMKIFPNPADGSCRVVTPYSNSQIAYSMTDILGNIIARQKAETDGRGAFALDVSRFSTGVYLLGVSSETKCTALPITVVH